MSEKPVAVEGAAAEAATTRKPVPDPALPQTAGQDVHPHDLAVMVRLERVNAPKQARSEKRLQEIIQALESLLDGRSFHQITIPDIAERAGCGTASIYARFKNKRSILVALHESVRDRQIHGIDERMSLERHQGLTFEESVLSVCRDLVEYFSRHCDFLRAAHLLGDKEVYARHASVIQHASERISELLASKLPEHVRTAGVDRRLDLATRAVFALLEQRVTFDEYPPGPFAAKSAEGEAAELASLYELCLVRTPPQP
jgi:AcrR family transcriptional regulator